MRNDQGIAEEKMGPQRIPTPHRMEQEVYDPPALPSQPVGNHAGKAYINWLPTSDP